MAILNFMLTFPGKEKKPTYFVEKIWEALLTKGVQVNLRELYEIGTSALPDNYKIGTNKPKLHTISEDMTNRWKAGMWIDFFINARTKKMFRFAPRVKVVSVQKVEIFYNVDSLWVNKNKNYPVIFVDDCELNDAAIKILSKNDGFDTIEEFFQWFNKDFTGKIIHWTDLKY